MSKYHKYVTIIIVQSRKSPDPIRLKMALNMLINEQDLVEYFGTAEEEPAKRRRDTGSPLDYRKDQGSVPSSSRPASADDD